MSEKAQLDKIPMVAVDDGYAQMKVVGDDPRGGKKPICLSIRSSIRHGSIGSVSGDGAIATYETDGGATKMTVSDEVAGESTQFDGFHTSAMDRILIAHALSVSGYTDMEINLWTGLPVSDFFRQERKNDELIERKRTNLMVPVKSIVPDAPACPSYKSITVGCQALAAFLDYGLDDDFNDRDVGTDKVAVVDIGGRTTDIAVILGGKRCDYTRSGTENIGVLDVHRNVANLVRQKFSTSDTYPADVLDRAVRTKSIKLWGKSHDISDILEKAQAESSHKLANLTQKMLGGGSDLDAILFVGGGASLFTDASKRFPNAVLVENPEFANARGLYKYGKMMED